MRAALWLVFGLALGWVLFHGASPVTSVAGELPKRPCIDGRGTAWRLMRGQAAKNGIVDQNTRDLTALLCSDGEAYTRDSGGAWHRFVPPRDWLPMPAPTP